MTRWPRGVVRMMASVASGSAGMLVAGVGAGLEGEGEAGDVSGGKAAGVGAEVPVLEVGWASFDEDERADGVGGGEEVGGESEGERLGGGEGLGVVAGRGGEPEDAVIGGGGALRVVAWGAGAAVPSA